MARVGTCFASTHPGSIPIIRFGAIQHADTVDGAWQKWNAKVRVLSEDYCNELFAMWGLLPSPLFAKVCKLWSASWHSVEGQIKDLPALRWSYRLENPSTDSGAVFHFSDGSFILELFPEAKWLGSCRHQVG